MHAVGALESGRKNANPVSRRRRFYAKRNVVRHQLSNIANHHQFTVNNVRISFPFTPYSTQTDYMSACVQALDSRENALLESPTGTGKTLSLLCATLAWREAFLLNAPKAFKTVDNKMQIIYSSRTHAQLAQALAELRRTAYGASGLTIAVLGSREQFCVNSSVLRWRKKSATVLTHKCKQATENQTCRAYRSFDKLISDNPSALATALDVEDLVNGRLQGTNAVCPYYTMRRLAKNADVLFMPYSYLLDLVTQARTKSLFKLENAIVIIDEGHNIAQTCETAASFEFYLNDFSAAAEQLRRPDAIADAGDAEQFVDKHMQICHRFLRRLQHQFGLLNFTTLRPPAPLSMKDLVNCARQARLTYKNIGSVLQTLASISRRNTEAADANEVPDDDNDEPIADNCSPSITPAGRDPLSNVERVIRTLEMLFFPHCGEKTGRSRQFATEVECLKEEALAKQHHSQYLVTVTKVVSKYAGRNVEARNAPPNKLFSCLCLSPYQPLRSLIQSKIRSLIVTSGTLSPMDALAHELGIPFNVRLACRHVIDSRQISGLILSHVPRGVWGADERWNSPSQLIPLQADFKNRDSKNFVGALGGAILQFLQCIPAGVLVFFPSYCAMTNCLRHWQELKVLVEMKKFKTVFIEDRDRGRFRADLADFRETVRELSNRWQSNKNRKNMPTGAVLFAVCRGKVSEGIDFPDDCARGVIVIGIPFGNVMDERVILKRHFLDKRKAAGVGNGSLTTLTSRAWYEREAWVAVNQAFGRVIRHCNDYGVCIMLDDRFIEEHERVQRQNRGACAVGYAVKTSKLPLYLSESVRPYTFEAAIEELRRFFTANGVSRDAGTEKLIMPPMIDNGVCADVGPGGAERLTTMVEGQGTEFAANENSAQLPLFATAAESEDDGFGPWRTEPIRNRLQKLLTITENCNVNQDSSSTSEADRECPRQSVQQQQLSKKTSSSGSNSDSNGMNRAFLESPSTICDKSHADKLTIPNINAVTISGDGAVIADTFPACTLRTQPEKRKLVAIAENADESFNIKLAKISKRRKSMKSVNCKLNAVTNVVTVEDNNAMHALNEAIKLARLKIVPEPRVQLRNQVIAEESDEDNADIAPPSAALQVFAPLAALPPRRTLSRNQQREDSRKCLEQALVWADAAFVIKEKFEISEHIRFRGCLEWLESKYSTENETSREETTHPPVLVTTANVEKVVKTDNTFFCDNTNVMPLANNVQADMIGPRFPAPDTRGGSCAVDLVEPVVVKENATYRSDAAEDKTVSKCDENFTAAAAAVIGVEQKLPASNHSTNWLGGWWRKIANVIKK